VGKNRCSRLAKFGVHSWQKYAKMSNQEIRNTLKKYVSDKIKIGDIEDSEDLFSSGLVNSLFAAQLVMFVESEFDISVAGDDLDMNNFKSIDNMYEFILKKNGSSAESVGTDFAE
jgi:methoxymalonate biosynthesis acyl carrier protein